jgi:hypothetical protein
MQPSLRSCEFKWVHTISVEASGPLNYGLGAERIPRISKLAESHFDSIGNERVYTRSLLTDPVDQGQ